MFDLHTVHLKCFCSFMCPLNVFQTSKTLTENFSLEYAEKMAKSKQQKLDMFPGTWGCPRHVGLLEFNVSLSQ